jgi:hypothetical protein
LTGGDAGERIAGISEVPSPGRLRRPLLAGAALVGAAAVGLAWLFLGAGSTSNASSRLASLGAAPGIAPPDYAYLDNAQVALYLGQLEGGLAMSEQLTQQLTQSHTAGLGAGSLSLGGSTGSQLTAERVVSPTATARFYQLLDLLGRDGYLHKIDATASAAKLEKVFAGVPEGSFVELQDCKLRIPSFVTLEELSRSAPGNLSPLALYLTATHSTAASSSYPTWYDELQSARGAAGRIKSSTSGGEENETGQEARQLARGIQALDAVGTDPRVPLASCDGKVDYHPRGVDLLFPIRLANLSPEQSLLAGRVTLVGKVVRAVRNGRQDYVDDASFATFSGPTTQIQSALGEEPGMWDELDADAVVLAPGAVILPIAIYK